MKKLLASLFAAAMLASLAGCGDADDGVVTDSPDTKPVPNGHNGDAHAAGVRKRQRDGPAEHVGDGVSKKARTRIGSAP